VLHFPGHGVGKPRGEREILEVDREERESEDRDFRVSEGVK